MREASNRGAVITPLIISIVRNTDLTGGFLYIFSLMEQQSLLGHLVLSFLVDDVKILVLHLIIKRLERVVRITFVKGMFAVSVPLFERKLVWLHVVPCLTHERGHALYLSPRSLFFNASFKPSFFTSLFCAIK